MSKQPAKMANGWLIMQDHSGRKVYGKSGKVTGGGAAVLIFPDDNLVIAGTINLAPLSEEIPVFNMAKHFLSDNVLIEVMPPDQGNKGNNSR